MNYIPFLRRMDFILHYSIGAYEITKYSDPRHTNMQFLYMQPPIVAVVDRQTLHWHNLNKKKLKRSPFYTKKFLKFIWPLLYEIQYQIRCSFDKNFILKSYFWRRKVKIFINKSMKWTSSALLNFIQQVSYEVHTVWTWQGPFFSNASVIVQEKRKTKKTSPGFCLLITCWRVFTTSHDRRQCQAPCVPRICLGIEWIRADGDHGVSALHRAEFRVGDGGSPGAHQASTHAHVPEGPSTQDSEEEPQDLTLATCNFRISELGITTYMWTTSAGQ